MKQRSGGSEAEMLLEKAAQCLTFRDFVGCRNYSIQVRSSDPKISGVDQILAIVDILTAGDLRVGNNHRDWYSILQLRRANLENLQLVRSNFVNLLNLVKAGGNKFSFSREAEGLLFDAWKVLSKPNKKTQYDKEIDGEMEIPISAEEEVERSCNHSKDKGYEGNSETFWTMCPYCYCMFEYCKVYEECCLRCQNCEKAFHGVAINAPKPETLVPGKDQYYLCYGVFRMRYEVPEKRNPKANEGKRNGENDRNSYGSCSNTVFVDISDDDDVEDDYLAGYGGDNKQGKNGDSWASTKKCNEELKKMDEGIQGNLKECSGITGLKQDGRQGKKKFKRKARRTMNVKAVVHRTKKLNGNGTEWQRTESVDTNAGVEGVNPNVECWNGFEETGRALGSKSYDPDVLFREGDDDIYVNLMDDPNSVCMF